MKKIEYKPHKLRTLKDLQYEKARLLVEIAYAQNELSKQSNNFIHGGFLQSFDIGWKIFSSGGKWFLSAKSISKLWNWIKKHRLKK